MKRIAPQSDEQGGDHRGTFVFALTVVAAYVSTFVISDLAIWTPRTGLLVGLGLVYVLLGVRGFEYSLRTGSLAAPLAYFAVQIGLAGVILWISRFDGLIALIVLPLASQATSNLPRVWAFVVSAFAWAAFVVPVTLIHGWMAALGAGISLLVGVVFTVAFTDIAVSEARARREVERLAAELQEANQKLREYAAQVEELATVKERNRLAREIHDTLGHHLTAMNVQLEAARMVLESDRERALRALESAQSLAREGLEEIRTSVATLRASPLERQSLPQVIRALAEEVRTAGIGVDVSLVGEPRPLPPETKLALYRAAQEALTNTRRHARASWVKVLLDYTDRAVVRLTVEDNGVGAAEPTGGFGLLGLRERVRLLDGEVRVKTAPREGFRLDVKVPA